MAFTDKCYIGYFGLFIFISFQVCCYILTKLLLFIIFAGNIWLCTVCKTFSKYRFGGMCGTEYINKKYICSLIEISLNIVWYNVLAFVLQSMGLIYSGVTSSIGRWRTQALRTSGGCQQQNPGGEANNLQDVHTMIARFMGPTWGPSGAGRTQVGPMLASWTLLFGHLWMLKSLVCSIISVLVW